MNIRYQNQVTSIVNINLASSPCIQFFIKRDCLGTQFVMHFNDLAQNAVEMSFIRSIELTVDEIRCFKITRKLFKQGSYQVFCKTQINRYCSISIYRAAASSLKCIRKKPRSGLRRIREIFFGKDSINQVKLVIETAWTRQLSRFLQNTNENAPII